MKKNILILAGKNILTAGKIAEAFRKGKVNVYIASVVELECLEDAPTHEMLLSLPLSEENCEELLNIIKDANLDLVVLDSFTLPDFLREKISCPIINIRHSLEPYLEEVEDDIYQNALTKGKKHHGCTVHRVGGEEKVFAELAFNLDGATIQEEGAGLVEAVTNLIEAEIAPIVINNILFDKEEGFVKAIEYLNSFFSKMGYCNLQVFEKE